MPALPATLSLYDQPEPVGGAEADIFKVHAHNSLLVKLFKAELTAEREALIRTLCARAGQAGVAWPYELRRFHKRPGLVLPRVAGEELHVLTSRTTRLRHFPGSSWRLAIAAARSYTEACAAVHAQNLAIVDVSARNALVDARGAVTLIDADSFLPPGGTASVATEEYQAPETLGRLPLPWQIQYDLHGIALILFELLFQKASPWPHDAGGARARFRFRRGTRVGLKPWEPGLDDLTPAVADLFGRAFGSASPQPPRASEWATALADMERLVRPCPQVGTHAYVSGEGRRCPWCACAARPDGRDVYRPEGDEPAGDGSAARPRPVSPAVSTVKVVRPAPRSPLPAYLFVLALLAAVIWMNSANLARSGGELLRQAGDVAASLWRWTEDPEERDWERARTRGFADVEAFLLRYPEGDHVAAARNRLALLAAGLPLGTAPRKVVAKIDVRVRNAPSLASGRAGYVESGSSVRPLGSVLGGRWYVIRRGGERAYVAAWLMRTPGKQRAARRRVSDGTANAATADRAEAFAMPDLETAAAQPPTAASGTPRSANPPAQDPYAEPVELPDPPPPPDEDPQQSPEEEP